MAGENEGGEDDDKKFTERFNRLFHAAMSEREKRSADKIKKDLDAQFEAFGGKMLDQFKALIPEPPKPEPQKPEPGKLPPEIEGRIKAAEKAAEKAAQAAAEEKAKREQAEQRARITEERQLLQAELAEAKVRPGVVGMAMNHLHARIVRDEGGAVRWKGEDGELVDVKAGIKGYLETDEGRELLPARPAGGAGSGSPGKGGKSGADYGYAELAGHFGVANKP